MAVVLEIIAGLIISYVVITTIIDTRLMGKLDIRLSFQNNANGYIIKRKNRIDMQTGYQCSAFSVAYLLRHHGISASGEENYPNMPDKMKDGQVVFPKGKRSEYPMREVGLDYISFARREPNLFKLLRGGVYLFAVMEWLCTVGYGCFPWISDAQDANIQNIIHILVTFFVVLLSIVSLIMIFSGTRKSNLKSLGIWSLVCLFVMFAGAIGTNVFPKTVFGIFERMSTFSVVVFNAVLGW